jgi:hypothetical protein
MPTTATNNGVSRGATLVASGLKKKTTGSRIVVRFRIAHTSLGAGLFLVADWDKNQGPLFL